MDFANPGSASAPADVVYVPRWEARHGDGNTLRIRRGPGGDLDKLRHGAVNVDQHFENERVVALLVGIRPDDHDGSRRQLHFPPGRRAADVDDAQDFVCFFFVALRVLPLGVVSLSAGTFIAAFRASSNGSGIDSLPLLRFPSGADP